MKAYLLDLPGGWTSTVFKAVSDEAALWFYQEHVRAHPCARLFRGRYREPLDLIAWRGYPDPSYAGIPIGAINRDPGA